MDIILTIFEWVWILGAGMMALAFVGFMLLICLIGIGKVLKASIESFKAYYARL